MSIKHENNGNCLKCAAIFDKYPGFHDELRQWFMSLQKRYNDCHISCAGRGKLDQEDAFKRGASKAHWTQSSHNWNAAIDVFQLLDGKAVWDKAWFKKVIGDNLAPGFTWYGLPSASFYELPHIEVLYWKKLKDDKKLKLVE